MFKVKSKQEIGSYLASIIRKDKTDSEFCREYMRIKSVLLSASSKSLVNHVIGIYPPVCGLPYLTAKLG